MNDPKINNESESKPRKPKKPLKQWQIDDAARLLTLFNNRQLKQATFAEKFGIESPAMVWQFLNARAPLNLKVAAKFAIGIRCPISDFSPTLAAELAEFLDLIEIYELILKEAGGHKVREPKATVVSTDPRPLSDLLYFGPRAGIAATEEEEELLITFRKLLRSQQKGFMADVSEAANLADQVSEEVHERERRTKK